MKFLIVLFVSVIVIIASAYADVRYRGNAKNKDYPGQCYYEELKQPIPINQSFRPKNREGHCESIYCRNDYVLMIESCGRHNLVPTENCKIDSDMSQIYPKCCPKLVCETDDNEIVIDDKEIY